MPAVRACAARRAGSDRRRYILPMAAVAAAPRRAFRKALQDRVFDPVYYFHGEDDFLKDDAVRKLIDSAVEPGTRDFNLDVVRAPDVTGEDLAALLASLPMMAERRAVVVRGVSDLKKDARAALDRYLDAPAADLVLVLTDGADAGKPDRGLLDRATALEFAPLSEKDLAAWIAHQAAEHGTSITGAAAALLHRAVGKDLPALAAEIDKLASYASGREIDESDVSAIVGVRRGETMGDLLDAVARRDARDALALLPHVLEQPKASGVTLVLALTTQTLALAWGRARRDEGLSAGRLAKEYYDFLKGAGSAFTGRPWGEAVSAWTGAVDRWSPESLERALDALLAADVALKETRLSSDAQQLETTILAMCVDDAVPRPRAAFAHGS